MTRKTVGLRCVARNPGGKWISLALLSGVALTAGSAAGSGAAPAATNRSWLAFDRPWLCRMWVTSSGFARHCTTRWHLDQHGNVISDDPNWVPVYTTSGAHGVARVHATDLLQPLAQNLHPSATPKSSAATVHVAMRLAPTSSAAQSGAPQPTGSITSGGPYSLWTPPPGYPAYALPDFAGDPNAAYYGTCTWYAQYRRPDERLTALGNAAQWAYTAPSRGLRVGTVPAVGATVVFQPGVFGAGAAGHVGHVEAVYGGGWFLISEMNAYLNGGGWGRVSYRYVVTAPGVSFIY